MPAQKITPCLWFDANAEAAVNHYISIFKNSKILSVTRYGAAAPGPEGSVMSITFQLFGNQEYVALNGGPLFKFTEAVSLMVNCDTQAEIDELWSRLSAGGTEQQCGWLKDKFGLSWQIVPRRFLAMMQDDDAERVQRVFQAMLPMKKLDLARIEAAYRGH